MTLAPLAPRPGAVAEARELAVAVAALRANRLRVSAARRAVLRALVAAGAPATVEHLATGVGGRVPPSDLASTYRNLERLEQIGLVRRVLTGDGPRRYVLTLQAGPGLVGCGGCGASLRLDGPAAEALRALTLRLTGYELDPKRFPITGLCPECRSTAGEAEIVHPVDPTIIRMDDGSVFRLEQDRCHDLPTHRPATASEPRRSG